MFYLLHLPVPTQLQKAESLPTKTSLGQKAEPGARHSVTAAVRVGAASSGRPIVTDIATERWCPTGNIRVRMYPHGSGARSQPGCRDFPRDLQQLSHHILSPFI